MERMSPVDKRKALEIVDLLIKTGLPFFPMPLLESETKGMMLKEFARRMEIITLKAEEDERNE